MRPRHHKKVTSGYLPIGFMYQHAATFAVVFLVIRIEKN